MVRKLLPFALCACISAGKLFATLNSVAVTLNVSATTKQTSTITAKRSDGSKDKVTKKIQTLEIECLSSGLTAPEPATLRWVFLSKDPLNGKFEYHSVGSKKVTIPVRGAAKFSAESEPLTKDEYSKAEGFYMTQYTAANIPVGWAVFLVQNGVVVKETASNTALIDWIGKNPPPREPQK